jgi:hypothetical protein
VSHSLSGRLLHEWLDRSLDTPAPRLTGTVLQDSYIAFIGNFCTALMFRFLQHGHPPVQFVLVIAESAINPCKVATTAS